MDLEGLDQLVVLIGPVVLGDGAGGGEPAKCGVDAAFMLFRPTAPFGLG